MSCVPDSMTVRRRPNRHLKVHTIIISTITIRTKAANVRASLPSRFTGQGMDITVLNTVTRFRRRRILTARCASKRAAMSEILVRSWKWKYRETTETTRPSRYTPQRSGVRPMTGRTQRTASAASSI